MGKFYKNRGIFPTPNKNTNLIYYKGYFIKIEIDWVTYLSEQRVYLIWKCKYWGGSQSL